jgi:hypothetical protein
VVAQAGLIVDNRITADITVNSARTGSFLPDPLLNPSSNFIWLSELSPVEIYRTGTQRCGGEPHGGIANQFIVPVFITGDHAEAGEIIRTECQPIFSRDHALAITSNIRSNFLDQCPAIGDLGHEECITRVVLPKAEQTVNPYNPDCDLGVFLIRPRDRYGRRFGPNFGPTVRRMRAAICGRYMPRALAHCTA